MPDVQGVIVKHLVANPVKTVSGVGFLPALKLAGRSKSE
jgi:hypothetical protein